MSGSRRRPIARTLAGVAVAALAVVVAVLAEEARRWPGRIDAGDAAYLAAPGGGDARPVPARRSARAAGDLLGVDDDLAYRRALQLVARGRVARFVFASRWIELISEAQRELGELEEATDDRSRRSDAANMLGIVYFDGAQASSIRRSDFLRASALAFDRAVRLNPHNADAKYNLELLLSRLRGDENRAGRQSGRSGAGPLGGDEAGLRLPGEGY
jgi:hypothetical protein